MEQPTTFEPVINLRTVKTLGLTIPDAVLLVVGSLRADELEALYIEAHALGLDALVEVHDEDELETALALDADVIGINNRNLEDFTVDIQTTVDLLAAIPTGKTVVSESGIRSRAEIVEGEDVASARVQAAAGHAVAVAYHATYERGGAEAARGFPGGDDVGLVPRSGRALLRSRSPVDA